MIISIFSLKMITTQFVNELGNKIEISIDIAPNDEISIKMIGPTSETENIITKKEFINLRHIMNKYIIFPHPDSTPTRHNISINPLYLSLIRDGKKKVEGRLNKSVFRTFKANDMVTWSAKDPQRNPPAKTVITAIRRYDSFEDMLINEGVRNVLPNVKKTGMASVEEGISIYRRFYSFADEQKYGVVAVELDIM